MSRDMAVRLKDVSKSYIVYADPKYWLADFVGLGRLLREEKHYRSLWALRDIDLEIPKGGKFAFIGRNGAGKSTLLRIISENIAPTSGTVEVHGHCEALMQLGAGFTPELTGRENAYRALAYMGITGKKAEEKLWDILDFSELDEFIEQPVRTYSAGMYLRLAFSVATVIAPEILIIDEILGAGDMYFQSKCLGRIQDLTSGPGTTVIFVSHDLESAQRICDTFVWIERGRIVGLGPSAEVRAAYEDSIRKQQEIRLRARNLRLSRRIVSALQAAGEDGVHLLGRLVVEGPEGKVTGPPIHAIRLYTRGKLAEEIHVGDAMDDNSSHYHSFIISDPKESTWSSPQRHGDRHTRVVMGAGNAVQGARFALFLAHDDFADSAFSLDVEIAYRDTSRFPCHLEFTAGLAGLKRMLTLEHQGDDRWKAAQTVIPRWVYTGQPDPDQLQSIPSSLPQGVPAEKRFGTGQVRISQVQFLGVGGQEKFVFQTGQPMSIVLTYETQDRCLLGSPMLWAVSFQRADGVVAATMISSMSEPRYAIRPAGTFRLTMNPVLLTKGEYRVSVVLFSELDLHGFSPHFTQSPFVYDFHRLAYQVMVEGSYAMELGIFRHPVQWSASSEHLTEHSLELHQK